MCVTVARKGRASGGDRSGTRLGVSCDTQASIMGAGPGLPAASFASGRRQAAAAVAALLDRWDGL